MSCRRIAQFRAVSSAAGNLNSFDPQSANGVLHQMHASDGVMKTSVMDPWIDQIRKPHLGYSPQTLKITVLDQIED